MPKSKTLSEQILPWLRENLGSLGAFTHTDVAALKAAVYILTLYALTRDRNVLTSFKLAVEQMQEKNQWYAYHSIALVMDWSDRPVIWIAAGLSLERTVNKPKCKHES